MPRLRIRTPGQPERVERVSQPRVVIGRAGDGADLVVQDERISRRHCALEHSPAGYLLRDLGGANGLLLNGKPLAVATVLRSGDLIDLGQSKMLFVADDTRVAPAPSQEETSVRHARPTGGVDGPDGPDREPRGELPSAAPSLAVAGETVPAPASAPAGARDAEGAAHYVLRYEKGGGKRTLPLGTDPLTIGRHASCGLVLHDDSVSSRHARIEPRADGYWIIDLESTNGVYLNGQRVHEALLKPGHRIRLGHVAVSFKRLVAAD